MSICQFANVPICKNRKFLSIFCLAFNRGLIADGEGWMKMIESRSKTSHTYNKETADEIAEAILTSYFLMFKELHNTMLKISTGQRDLFDEAK